MPVMRHLNVGGVTYDTVGEASVTQVQGSGTKIATVSIDGASTDLYAPAGSSVDPATAAPNMDGTAAVGSSVKYAREDHVHPTDTSRQATLVSGTNIKTVNGTSLLGSGNISLPTASDIPTKTSDLTNDSGFVTDAGVTSFNGSTGAVTYTAPVTSVNGSTGAVTVAVPGASSTAPVMDGTAAVGTGTTWARADHRHPTDTSRASAADLTSLQTTVAGKQDALVSGTSIKTVNGTSLLGSGDLTVGGGGGSELTLYADTDFTNLWIDAGRTTTLFESFEYDYNVAKAEMSKFSAIKIWDRSLSAVYFVSHWEVDTIDESFEVVFGKWTTVAISTRNYEILAAKKIYLS